MKQAKSGFLEFKNANKLLQINLKDKAETVRHNRSLSLWQPFRPACYVNYSEAIKGIFKQGQPMSFYKGNGVRSLHIILFHKINADLKFRVETNIPT